MDEVFGEDNFISQIPFKTSPGNTTASLPPCSDYLLWYAKSHINLKFRKLLLAKDSATTQGASFDLLELIDGSVRRITSQESANPSLIPIDARPFRWADPRRKGASESAMFSFSFQGTEFIPGKGMTWKTTYNGLIALLRSARLGQKGSQLQYRRYIDDFPCTELLNVWSDTMNSFLKRNYVVQTNDLVIQRCLLMATDPGDLVLDPTCGSGTTAYVAEHWGRRWITFGFVSTTYTLFIEPRTSSHR